MEEHVRWMRSRSQCQVFRPQNWELLQILLQIPMLSTENSSEVVDAWNVQGNPDHENLQTVYDTLGSIWMVDPGAPSPETMKNLVTSPLTRVCTETEASVIQLIPAGCKFCRSSRTISVPRDMGRRYVVET